MIDALATQPHYRDHVMPVWDALPTLLRGMAHTGTRLLPPGAPTIVASYIDARLAMRRPVIYLEHGAGQTYSPGFSSYAGGRGKEMVDLFLSPSERVAAINRAAYPNAEHAVVGCPLLDKWVGYRPVNPEPFCALAWHWNGLGVAPEARSAFPRYASALPQLTKSFRLLGHGHPRAMKRLIPFYEQHGIEWTADFGEVLRRADVLVFDNTSAGFMFAALDRPVVVLDAPWYQKAWGGRFWEWADVGVRISDPAQLSGAITEALRDAPRQAQRRREINREIYGTVDGHAAERAAAAITGVFSQAVAA